MRAVGASNHSAALVDRGLAAPIAGATSVAQLQEVMGAAALTLDSATIAALDAASAWR